MTFTYYKSKYTKNLGFAGFGDRYLRWIDFIGDKAGRQH